MGQLCHVLVSLSIEADDLVGYGRRPTVGLFVLEVEYLRSQESISVVQSARWRRQKGRKSGLASIDIAQHSDSQVVC